MNKWARIAAMMIKHKVKNMAILIEKPTIVARENERNIE